MMAQFQEFSDALAEAYQKYADELQRRGPKDDPDLFYEYLCDICGLIAVSVEAESVSILMRGEEDPKQFPKGHLKLVACNKGKNGAPGSVWYELLGNKIPVIADLSVKSITKHIYQSQTVLQKSFDEMHGERSGVVGKYDLGVWKGGTLRECFRDYLGLPIRIQPTAQPVGVLRVENKCFPKKQQVHWDDAWKDIADDADPGVVFPRGGRPEEKKYHDILLCREGELRKLPDKLNKEKPPDKNKKEKLPWKFPAWKDGDAPLVALAASYVAKVEELRLTMLAAQLNPPVPLDSRDFAYLRICDDHFAKSASAYLGECKKNAEILEFQLGRLLFDLQQDPSKTPAELRELRAVQITTRVKDPRNLFDRLAQKLFLLRQSRRVLSLLECKAAFEASGNAGPKENNPYTKEHKRIKVELKKYKYGRDRPHEILENFQFNGDFWRDAGFVTPPIPVKKERGYVRLALSLLAEGMKSTSFAEEIKKNRQRKKRKHYNSLGKREAEFLSWLGNFEDKGGKTFETREECIAAASFRYYSRHPRHQISYMLQLIRTLQGMNKEYKWSHKWLKDFVLSLQENAAKLEVEDVFSDTTEQKTGVPRDKVDLYKLTGNHAATYKRARHIRTMEWVPRRLEDLLHEAGRFDVLGCRLVCWYNKTRLALAKEILDWDPSRNRERKSGPWIVQKIKLHKVEASQADLAGREEMGGKDESLGSEAGYSAVHLRLLLPPARRRLGGEEELFAKFAKYIAELGREFLETGWKAGEAITSVWDTPDWKNSDMEKEFNSVEFLVYLMDGRHLRASRNALHKCGFDSWCEYYMSLTVAEVQIRAALMDTWSNQYHDPVYKVYESVDLKTRNKLIVLAAKLEKITEGLYKVYENMDKTKKTKK